jgi:hypothetical protein
MEDNVTTSRPSDAPRLACLLALGLSTEQVDLWRLVA